MQFFDLLILSVVIFLVINFVQSFLRGRSRSSRLNSERDALKEMQDFSREQSAFSDMTDEQKESYQDSMTLSVCFARFALQVGRADGVLTQAELNSIVIFFAGAHPAFVQHVQEVLQQDLQHPETIDWQYNLDEARRSLAKPQWQNFSAIMFDGLIRISLADGVVHARELEVIFGIMSDLGWTRQRAESWFHTRTGFGAAFGGQEYSSQQGRSGKQFSSSGQKLQEAFDILGLEPQSSQDTIKKRYRQLVLEHHPDKYAHMGSEMQKAATQRFQVIQEAYDYIIKT